MGQMLCSYLICKEIQAYSMLLRPKILNTFLYKALLNNKYLHVSSHMLKPLVLL